VREHEHGDADRHRAAARDGGGKRADGGSGLLRLQRLAGNRAVALALQRNIAAPESAV
jgi:hypothetical protein